MNLLEQISQTHAIFNLLALIVLSYSHNYMSIFWTQIYPFFLFKKKGTSVKLHQH